MITHQMNKPALSAEPFKSYKNNGATVIDESISKICFREENCCVAIAGIEKIVICKYQGPSCMFAEFFSLIAW